MFQSRQGPTEDGYGNAADSELPGGLVCDAALIGAAVLSGGSWDTEGVDDPVREGLLHLHGIHSL